MFGIPDLRRFILVGLLSLPCVLSFPRLEARGQCVIPANGDGSDDTPAILEAFKKCRKNGRIVFENTTYHINKPMRTTDLEETDIHIKGTLLWSTDLQYWLDHPQETGFQNASAAWFLGGKNVVVEGFGYGTLDGNGQAWYDMVKGQSNYPNRPHALAVWKSDKIEFRNLRMVQSQMWTLVIMHSKEVLLENLFIQSRSSNKNPARNTDGANTIDSDRVTFRNVFIRNGDDAIAIKGNSTNILIEDCTFDNSLGLAFGSLGQYPGQTERVENITARRIKCLGTRHGAYVKTWTGDRVSYPPNGGGGGLGYLRNVKLSDFTLTELRNPPFSITQCTSFTGTGERGDCESSLYKISDITIQNWKGDADSSYVASMDCSKAAGGCTDITIKDVSLTQTDGGAAISSYRCRDVHDTHGFTCG